MASQNDGGFRSFLSTASLSAFTAVDIQSDGSINAAGAGALGVGVLQEDAPAGFYGDVKLWSAPGTWAINVANTIVTPGTQYSLSGGVVIPVSGTSAPAYLKAVAASSNPSPGVLVAEFTNSLPTSL